MKTVIGITLSILVGGFLGFFGALNSVFSDGELTERLVFIAIVLVIYGVLGVVWGFLIPQYSWKWGVFIGVPGVLFLLLFLLGGFNPYYFVYIALIFGFSCLGGWGGSHIRRLMKK
jgi:hypothetical protein